MEVTTFLALSALGLLLVLLLLLLPPCCTALLLLLRTFALSVVSIYTFPARSHARWLLSSPFLCDDEEGEEYSFVCSYASAAVSSLRYNNLNVVRYKEEEGEQVKCLFCLCVIGDGEEVGELKCGHVFHWGCLEKWLRHRRSTCPTCRKFLFWGEELSPRSGGVEYIDNEAPILCKKHTACLVL